MRGRWGCNNKDCLDCKKPFCKYDIFDSALSEFQNQFPERLRTLLKKRGYKNKDFAEKSGMSNDNLSLYVNGKSYPRADTLILMCKTLECSADYLLGLKESDK